MYDFKDYFSQDIEITERALERSVPKCKDRRSSVVDAMRYTLLGGGKRLRSTLALEFCAECGGDVEEILPFACALEMVHAYSLIHDDLPCMDDDNMRRGKASCHIAYGEATALLAGDALLTKAFELMLSQTSLAPERVLESARVLAQAAGVEGMIGGQVMDLENEGKAVPILEIEETDHLKTGALIRAAAKIGCIIGGASRETIALADEYARSIGVAFQITDDILDCTGSLDVLGKPIGSDAGNKKTTYVSVYGITEAKTIAKRHVDDAKAALEKMETKSRFLYDLADFILNRKN